MFEAPQQEKLSIGLTPLIDIIFILLIFVILAANFERVRGLKVALPEAGKTQGIVKKSLHITITKEGHLFLEKNLIQKQNFSRVLHKMRKKFSTLILRADRLVPLRYVVFVLDQASKVGFHSISIATKKIKK